MPALSAGTDDGGVGSGPYGHRWRLTDPADWASPHSEGEGSEAVVLTCGFALERVTGIEPALSAWEADVLPLNYTRVHVQGLVGTAEEPGAAGFARATFRSR